VEAISAVSAIQRSEDPREKFSVQTKQAPSKRRVSLEEATEWAREEGLLFLGETSCLDEINNCGEIFNQLLA